MLYEWPINQLEVTADNPTHPLSTQGCRCQGAEGI